MSFSRSSEQSISKISPGWRFCILATTSVLLWWRPLMATLSLAVHDDQYTHLLLILPVSIGLLCIDWKPVGTMSLSGARLGLTTLGGAGVIALVARWQIAQEHADERLSLYMLALVIWWIGSFIVCFGTGAFRRSLFPLCFLFWLVPFPEFLLNPIVRLLQQGSVISAHLLFTAFGVPTLQSGTLITIPRLTVEVAPECSSIRSSLMLVVTTMVVAQVSLRSSWRKALVVAVAIPLSVAKNGLRIFVLAMLGTRVDPSFLNGRLHHQGGIIYLTVALITVFLLIWAVRRQEKRTTDASAPVLDTLVVESPI